LEDQNVTIIPDFIDTPVSTEQRIQSRSNVIGDEEQHLVTEYTMRSGFRYEVILAQNGERRLVQKAPLPGTHAWWAIHHGSEEEEEAEDESDTPESGGVIELA